MNNSVEKDLRRAIRRARLNGASHQFASWLGRDVDGLAKTLYIVGKKKLKVFLANKHLSKKSTSIFIGETKASDNATAYADIAEMLEKAEEKYYLLESKDYWGFVDPIIFEREKSLTA